MKEGEESGGHLPAARPSRATWQFYRSQFRLNHSSERTHKQAGGALPA